MYNWLSQKVLMKFKEFSINYVGKYPQNAFLFKIISRMGVWFASVPTEMTLKKKNWKPLKSGHLSTVKTLKGSLMCPL